MQNNNDNFRFSHAKIQEVVYGEIPQFRRKRLHAQMAKILEEEQHRTNADFNAMIAHHYLLANEDEKALEYLLRAGKQSAALYANDIALNLYQKALAIVDRIVLPDAVSKQRLRLEVLQGIGFAYREINNFDQADIYFLQCLELVRALGDKESEIWLLHRRIEVLISKKDYQGAEVLCNEALVVAQSTNDPKMLLHVYGDFADVDSPLYREYMVAGNKDKADEVGNNLLHNATEQVNLAERLNNLDEIVRGYKNLGVYYYYVKHNYDTALVMFERAAAVAIEHDLKGSKYVLQWVGDVWRIRGDLDKAQKAYEQYLGWAREIGARYAQLKAYQCLGIIAMERTNYDEALRLFNISSDINKVVKAPAQEIETSIYRGMALERQNKPLDAFAEYREALKLAGVFDEDDTDVAVLLKIGRMMYSFNEKSYTAFYIKRYLETNPALLSEQRQEIIAMLQE